MSGFHPKYADGRETWANMGSDGSNPYDVGSADYLEWQRGFDEARAEELGPEA